MLMTFYSRPYYYIWSCRSTQQHLILQPSPGVSWHGGHKRPPLFEPDMRQQSAHYRKWTKPALREVRNQYDGIMKEANKSSRRRFMLIGSPQVILHTPVFPNSAHFQPQFFSQLMHTHYLSNSVTGWKDWCMDADD